MGKRFGKGNDATQDVSLSQFVPPKAPPARGNQKNDMSLWGGVVVGTSDFAPPVLKRPKPTSSRWKWIAIAGAVVAVVAVAVLVLTRDSGSKSSPSAAPVAKDSKATVPTPPIVDDKAKVPDKGSAGSAVAAAAVDKGSAGSGSAGSAASGAGSGSADGRGPTVAVVTGDVDAISGVAPVIKAKKKPLGKKPVKKPAPKKAVPKRKK